VNGFDKGIDEQFRIRVYCREKRGSDVDKPYLTVDEIAQALDVSVETVRSYINMPKDKNPLPAFKLGREWRVRRTDFDKWVQDRMNIRPDDQ